MANPGLPVVPLGHALLRHANNIWTRHRSRKAARLGQQAHLVCARGRDARGQLLQRQAVVVHRVKVPRVPLRRLPGMHPVPGQAAPFSLTSLRECPCACWVCQLTQDRCGSSPLHSSDDGGTFRILA